MEENYNLTTIEYLQKYSPLSEGKIRIIQNKGIVLEDYLFEIKELSRKGLSPEQIFIEIRRQMRRKS